MNKTILSYIFIAFSIIFFIWSIKKIRTAKQVEKVKIKEKDMKGIDQNVN